MSQETLLQLFKQNNIAAVRERINTGEKLPPGIPDYDRRHIYTMLAQKKAFDIIDFLVKDRFIETDLYEYETLEGSVFEALFKYTGQNEEEQSFLTTFLTSFTNINDAVQDQTLLDLAFHNGAPVAVVQILLEAGCNVHYKNNYEMNFLYKIIREFAIKEPQGVAYIELLLREGIDPNEGNIVKETPLHLAVSKQKQSYIDLLLAHGADPNQPDKNGESPFYYALVHQVCKPELYQKLRQYAAADFNSVNKEGETLLIGAIRMRRSATADETALITALINDGADIYQTAPYYSNQKSALDWILEQPAASLEALLDMDIIDVNRKDNQGNTPLHQVCAIDVNFEPETAKQVYRKVKLLLERGADAGSVNDRDQTPLMLAAGDNLKVKTVALLMNQ